MRSVCAHTEEKGAAVSGTQKGTGGVRAVHLGLAMLPSHGWGKLPTPAPRLAGWSSQLLPPGTLPFHSQVL